MNQPPLEGLSASDAPDRLTAADPAAWPVAPGWRPVTEAFFAGDAGQKLLGFLRGRLVDQRSEERRVGKECRL